MQEENIYKVFKALTESEDMTRFDNAFNNSASFKSQRQLAEELGFSLGKLNYCLKALMEKGLVKVENFYNARNKRRYAYQLTPAGLKEKARITVRFLRSKEREYEEIKQQLTQLRNEVDNLRPCKSDDETK
jgi:EPS-associated MarR family transcriptional regulator